MGGRNLIDGPDLPVDDDSMDATLTSKVSKRGLFELCAPGGKFEDSNGEATLSFSALKVTRFVFHQ